MPVRTEKLNDKDMFHENPACLLVREGLFECTACSLRLLDEPLQDRSAKGPQHQPRDPR
jgi:hypothetical protein